jgi:hypothetical protein
LTTPLCQFRRQPIRRRIPHTILLHQSAQHFPNRLALLIAQPLVFDLLSHHAISKRAAVLKINHCRAGRRTLLAAIRHNKFQAAICPP